MQFKLVALANQQQLQNNYTEAGGEFVQVYTYVFLCVCVCIFI